MTCRKRRIKVGWYLFPFSDVSILYTESPTFLTAARVLPVRVSRGAAPGPRR